MTFENDSPVVVAKARIVPVASGGFALEITQCRVRACARGHGGTHVLRTDGLTPRAGDCVRLFWYVRARRGGATTWIRVSNACVARLPSPHGCWLVYKFTVFPVVVSFLHSLECVS